MGKKIICFRRSLTTNCHLTYHLYIPINTSRDELMSYFKTMYTMRRMEITCDSEYKARNISGFCHLYEI